MSLIKNESRTTDEETLALRDAFIRRARWMKLLIDELKDACDDWEVRARRAITKYGEDNGAKFCGIMENPGVGELSNFVGAGKTRKIFDIEVLEQNDEHYFIDFHHCPLVTGWQMEGCSDEEIALLCDIAMDGDRGCACGVGVDFELVSKIADGDDVCGLRFYNRAEKESK